MPHYIKKHRTK